MELTGIEVDGHGVYADLHSRSDYAGAYAEQTGNPRVRYEVGDFLELLSEPSERNLGGSLHLHWPDPERPAGALPPAEQVERIHRALNAAFDDLRARTAATSARSNIADGRFEAELTYANGPLAADAFKRLHVSLRARGLGARQWTRDITVPRPR